MMGYITVTHPNMKSKTIVSIGADAFVVCTKIWRANQIKKTGTVTRTIVTNMVLVRPSVALKLCLIAFIGVSSDNTRKNCDNDNLTAIKMPGTISRNNPAIVKTEVMISVTRNRGK